MRRPSEGKKFVGPSRLAKRLNAAQQAAIIQAAAALGINWRNIICRALVENDWAPTGLPAEITTVIDSMTSRIGPIQFFDLYVTDDDPGQDRRASSGKHV